VVITVVTEVAPQSFSLNLGDIVSKYGSRPAVAAFEVTNGMNVYRQHRKSLAVRDAKKFLRRSLPDNVVVLGGVAFLDNYSCAKMTNSSVDISLHVGDVDSGHYKAAVAAVADGVNSGSQRWTLPNDKERYMVEYVMDVSQREGIPLDHFFTPARHHFWRTIKHFLPWGFGEYAAGIRLARGQIMEEYVARLLREPLVEGVVLLNYAFPVAAGKCIDVDNLVVAPSVDALVRSLRHIDAAQKAEVRFAESVYTALRKAA
jgi:hypothetical protein